MALIDSMSIQQTLQKEIEESKEWLSRENEDSTYKRDLEKRIVSTPLIKDRSIVLNIN